MIRINNVKVPLNYDEKTLLHLAGAKLNLRGGVESVRIAKRAWTRATRATCISSWRWT